MSAFFEKVPFDKPIEFSVIRTTLVDLLKDLRISFLVELFERFGEKIAFRNSDSIGKLYSELFCALHQCVLST